MSSATDRPPRILLVEDNPADAEWVCEWLEECKAGFRIEHAGRLSEAAARLAGSGADLVLLDLMLPDSGGLDTFLEVRRRAPASAVVVLSGLQDEALALRAVQAGAQDYLVKGRTPPEILVRSLRYALERQRSGERLRAGPGGPLRSAGKLIAVLGAKGGVGATTVAANLAAALARRTSVIAAELEGMGAGLAECFRIQAGGDSLWESERPDEVELGRRLWKLPSGLRVLLGPRSGPAPAEVTPEQADAVLERLIWMADRVVLDLPPRASAANCAAIRRADSVVLVIEREPAAVAAGRRMLAFLRGACRVQGLVRLAVVNRVSFACPMPLNEIERELELAVSAVIPPNPDLCLQARKTGAPLVYFQPESPVAAALLELAGKLEEEALAARQTA
jgi:Flp pilus assembly CpaE family ATPase